MTDLDKNAIYEAFMAGFVKARKSSFQSQELGEVTQQSADTQFERWWDRNHEE